MKSAILFFNLILLSFSGPSWAKGSGVQVTELLKTTQSWDGQDLPAYPQGQPEITIVRITIPPGVALPMHRHPMINAGVMLSGEVTVYTEKNEIRRVVAGEALSELVNTWHYGKNEGEIPAEIIVFYAGVSKTPITVLKKSENKKVGKD